MSGQVVVSVGTRKGLFLFRSSARRDKWRMEGPFLKGWQVYHAVVDVRGTPRLFAAASSDVFAATTMKGDLSKFRFQGAKRPPVPPKLLPSHIKLSQKWGLSTTPRIWHIEPGRVSEKKVLYAGTAPAALFKSEDDGKTWQEIPSLTNHPTRKDWSPGAGGMCLHTIQLDQHNPDRMYVAISAAGAFRTDDSGKTWKTINKCVSKFTGAPKDSNVGT